jgi:hypothetical protein
VAVVVAGAGGVFAVVADSPANREGNRLADIGVVAGAVVAVVGPVLAVTFGAIAIGMWRERNYGAAWMIGVNAFRLPLGIFYVATSIAALGDILLAGPGVVAGWHLIARREASARRARCGPTWVTTAPSGSVRRPRWPGWVGPLAPSASAALTYNDIRI